MGLIGSLFSNPQKDLDRATRLFKGGDDLEKALELTERVIKKGDQHQASEAKSLQGPIRTALLTHFKERSKRSVKSNFLDDAVDWLNLALRHTTDEAQEAELRAEIKTLVTRMEAEADQDEGPLVPQPTTGEAEAEVDEMDFETHFQLLMGTLTQERADEYEKLPSRFHEAYFLKNNSQLEEAIAILDELLEQQADHEVYTFERAHCALLAGDIKTARLGFEKVWPAMGDASLDDAGTLNVPALWARTALADGDPEAIIGRLEELAAPQMGRPVLTEIYAAALIGARKVEEGIRFIVEASKTYTHHPAFPHMLAGVYNAQGDWQRAIQCLETSVTSSCTTGNCKPMPKHVPSMRDLITLYLNHDTDLERAGEVLMHLEHTLGAHMGKTDWQLYAVYYEKTGNAKAASRARLAAEQVEDTDGMNVGVPKISAYADTAIL